jgi:hypothetical protein
MMNFLRFDKASSPRESDKECGEDLFPTLRSEALETLVELDHNSHKLYDYFAEQTSTKQLFLTNESLRQSNFDAAGRILQIKEKIDELRKDMQSSIQTLESAKQELQDVLLLCSEIELQHSFDSLKIQIEKEIEEEENKCNQYLRSQLLTESVNYINYASKVEELRKRIHQLQFSREWILLEKGTTK